MEESVYQDILATMAEGVYFVDRGRRITFWNGGAERITGYRADEVIDRSCSEGFLRHVNADGAQLCLKGCPLRAVMRDGRSRRADVFLHHKDGHRVPVTVKGRAITDAHGQIVGSVELFHPRPGTRFAERSVGETDDPYVDPLTGIGTRRFGELNLEALLADVAAGITTLGVMFLDVDHFKTVNDTHGHLTGDAVLRMVAQDLASGLHPEDHPVRWGGEEFVALLPGADPASLSAAADRLRILIEHSWLQRGDEQIRVTASVGATMARPDDDLPALLDRADRLMYDSKRAGRNIVTTDTGTLPRRGEPPLVGCTVPWETPGVDAEA